MAEPYLSTLVFLGATGLILYRLAALESKGLAGTVLGTMVMPLFSGASNLLFAWIMASKGSEGVVVLENCLVNNATNMTLLLGLPILLWRPKKAPKGKSEQVNRLNLCSTLLAQIFFMGALWLMARDGSINHEDGLLLIGLFAFWQMVNFMELLKTKVRQKVRWRFSMLFDLALIAFATWLMLGAIDHLVDWVNTAGSGFFSPQYLGWLSGWLMVLPNAIPAFYYTRIGRQDIAVSSQVGDAHICIPLCIGIFAAFQTMSVPLFFELGLLFTAAACGVHLLIQVGSWRTPKWVAAAFCISYAAFVYWGRGA